MKRTVLGLGLFLTVLISPLTMAQNPIAGHPDVRILIDISGSMKSSDPTNLRAPALELLVRLLPPGSKAGVWLFGDGVRTLMPHVVIDDAWRERAVASVRAIDNSGQRTNIPAAVEAALYDLNRLDPGYRTSVVLLTDGKVDVSSSAIANVNAARSMLEQRAPILGETGVPVHTIALSNDADWGFLRRLAESTRGLAEKAESADSLTRVFLQALEMVAPTARVPIEGGQFQIDAGVEQLTALIFYGNEERTKISLIDPDNRSLEADVNGNGVQWFSNEKFSLVTVDAPRPGLWRLVAPRSDENRITVVSDLSIDVDPLPNSLPLDTPAELGIRLLDRKGVISDKALIEAFSITLRILQPDGNSESIKVSERYEAPSNGEYRVAVPPFSSSGVHKLTVRVEALELVRELPMFVDVQASPEAARVVTKNDEALRTEGLPWWIYPLVSGVVGLSLLVWVARSIQERRRRQRIQRAKNNQDERDAPLVNMRLGDDSSIDS
jgi:hypothetical protein